MKLDGDTSKSFSKRTLCTYFSLLYFPIGYQCPTAASPSARKRNLPGPSTGHFTRSAAKVSLRPSLSSHSPRVMCRYECHWCLYEDWCAAWGHRTKNSHVSCWRYWAVIEVIGYSLGGSYWLIRIPAIRIIKPKG